MFYNENFYSHYPVQYNPIGGPNSNSLAHWFLLQTDLYMYYSAPPGTDGNSGWYQPIY